MRYTRLRDQKPGVTPKAMFGQWSLGLLLFNVVAAAVCMVLVLAFMLYMASMTLYLLVTAVRRTILPWVWTLLT
jgi:hypothetical protein